MKEWVALYKSHTEMRTGTLELRTALLGRLVKLAKQGYLDATIQGRFTRRDRGSFRELYIQQSDESSRVEMRGLPLLDDARLTLLALVSRKNEHLHQFTAMIDGRASDGRPWAAAVHLENDSDPKEYDHKGSGACGHAALHCHVGPTLDDEPKVRVPLPAVGPVGALDWLLSTVVPDWEIAPWPDVVKALAQQDAQAKSKT